MHGRRPNSVDGPRSNSPGLPTGRISTENSAYGWGFYNYNHKGSNRDFARFPAKPFSPPPPPPPPPPMPPLPSRRADVLMEAGRLAAEYLVSQGLLPANLLPGKLTFGDFKSPEFRVWDQKEFASIQTDGRTSALARLGDAMPDTGVPVRDDEVWPRRMGNSELPFYGRRRFAAVDENVGSRTRRKRRSGSFRGYGSDWRRENGRPGKAASFNDMPESEEDVPDYQIDNKLANMDADEAPKFAEPAPTKETAVFPESRVENCNATAADGVGIVEISSGGGKVHSSVIDDAMVEADGLEERGVTPVLDGRNDNAVLSSDVGDDKQVANSDQNGKETGLQDAPTQVCKLEESSTSKQANLNNPNKNMDCDLVRFCNLTKVPTKARSVRQRLSSSQPVQVSSSFSNSENKISSGTICEAAAVDPTAQNSMDSCLSKTQLPEDTLSGFTESDVPEATTSRDVDKPQEVDLAFDVDQEKGDKVLVAPSSVQEDLVKHSPGFDNVKDEIISQDDEGSICVSLTLVRGNEEFVHHDVSGSKRPREWLSPRSSQPDGYLQNHDLGLQAANSNDENFPNDEEMVEAVEASSKLDTATPMTVEGPELGTSMQTVLSNCDRLPHEEKQLLPCAFPMFDINLSAEFDDVIQNHVASQYSLTEVEEEAFQRVGLLIRDISNGNQGRVDPCNDFFIGQPGNGKWTGYDINTIEAGVIRTALVELFNKMPLVRKLYQNRSMLTKLKCLVCCGSNREMQTTYSSLEDLLDHTKNSDYLPKVHRGYGSAITDLLEMDLLNNSSSSVAINDLHNDVYLGFNEVLPGYDDPIYLSLDEISVDLPEV